MKRVPLIFVLAALVGTAFGQANQNNFPGGGSGKGSCIATVGTLSSACGTVKGTQATVTDGTSTSDCTGGGSSQVAPCTYNGSAWQYAGSTGTVSPDTIGYSVTCSGAACGAAPLAFDSTKYSGADGCAQAQTAFGVTVGVNTVVVDSRAAMADWVSGGIPCVTPPVPSVGGGGGEWLLPSGPFVISNPVVIGPKEKIVGQCISYDIAHCSGFEASNSAWTGGLGGVSTGTYNAATTYWSGATATCDSGVHCAGTATWYAVFNNFSGQAPSATTVNYWTLAANFPSPVAEINMSINGNDQESATVSDLGLWCQFSGAGQQQTVTDGCGELLNTNGQEQTGGTQLKMRDGTVFGMWFNNPLITDSGPWSPSGWTIGYDAPGSDPTNATVTADTGTVVTLTANAGTWSAGYQVGTGISIAVTNCVNTGYNTASAAITGGNGINGGYGGTTITYANTTTGGTLTGCQANLNTNLNYACKTAGPDLSTQSGTISTATGLTQGGNTLVTIVLSATPAYTLWVGSLVEINNSTSSPTLSNIAAGLVDETANTHGYYVVWSVQSATTFTVMAPSSMSALACSSGCGTVNFYPNGFNISYDSSGIHNPFMRGAENGTVNSSTCASGGSQTYSWFPPIGIQIAGLDTPLLNTHVEGHRIGLCIGCYGASFGEEVDNFIPVTNLYTGVLIDNKFAVNKTDLKNIYCSTSVQYCVLDLVNGNKITGANNASVKHYSLDANGIPTFEGGNCTDMTYGWCDGISGNGTATGKAFYVGGVAQ